MTTPTIHLNGTSRGELQEQYRAAVLAIEEAIRAVCNASPNGRDYYPQGPDAITRAIAEHTARLDALTKVKDELIDLYLSIEG